MKPSCVSVLPKLPVPKLSETLEKYLLCIKAIVPEPQFDRTQSIVREFGKTGGLGEKLQKELEKYAEREENWVRYEFSRHVIIILIFNKVSIDTTKTKLVKLKFVLSV